MDLGILITVLLAIASGLAFIAHKYPTVYKSLSELLIMVVGAAAGVLLLFNLGGMNHHIDYLYAQINKDAKISLLEGSIRNLGEIWITMKNVFYWTVPIIFYLVILRYLPIFEQIERDAKKKGSLKKDVGSETKIPED